MPAIPGVAAIRDLTSGITICPSYTACCVSLAPFLVYEKPCFPVNMRNCATRKRQGWQGEAALPVPVWRHDGGYAQGACRKPPGRNRPPPRGCSCRPPPAGRGVGFVGPTQRVRLVLDPLLIPQAEYAAGSEKAGRHGGHPCHPFGQPRPGRAATAEDPALLTPRPARGAGCNRMGPSFCVSARIGIIMFHSLFFQPKLGQPVHRLGRHIHLYRQWLQGNRKHCSTEPSPRQPEPDLRNGNRHRLWPLCGQRHRPYD